MAEFVMPSLGADMESGTLLAWYVKPGDAVKRGDIVALVDTSKAEIEVEIFDEGVIGELLVPEGRRVPVGTALATVLPAGAPAVAAAPVAAPGPAPVAPAAVPVAPAAVPVAPAAVPVAPAAVPVAPAAVPVAPAAVPVAPAAVPVAPAAVTPPVAAVTPDGHRVHASPLARRVAADLGVQLESVTGTGPHGAITRADVEGAAGRAVAPPAPAPAPSPPPAAAPPPPAAAPPSPAAAPPPPAEAADRQRAMREAIAALMARSKREIPHYYLELVVDMSRALEWLREENLTRPVNDRLLSSALLLSAVARATAAMPEMNGFWVDGGFQPGAGVHLGVAISLRGGGLIAPALHDADRRTLGEIMAGVRDLVARARNGRLRSSEMADPTITVTNLGDRGVDLVHGVIYPPQVALVGFGSVRERPWAVDGMLGVRPLVTVTLAADHRAGDGHTGGRFLSLIERQLQNPEGL